MLFADSNNATASRHRRGLPSLLAVIHHQRDYECEPVQQTAAERRAAIETYAARAAARLPLFVESEATHA